MEACVRQPLGIEDVGVVPIGQERDDGSDRRRQGDQGLAGRARHEIPQLFSLIPYVIGDISTVSVRVPCVNRVIGRRRGWSMSCGKVGRRGSAADGEGAVVVDGVVYHARQRDAVGWCHVR